MCVRTGPVRTKQGRLQNCQTNPCYVYPSVLLLILVRRWLRSGDQSAGNTRPTT